MRLSQARTPAEHRVQRMISTGELRAAELWEENRAAQEQERARRVKELAKKREASAEIMARVEALGFSAEEIRAFLGES